MIWDLKRLQICQSPGSSTADKPIRNRQVMHYLLVRIQLSINTNGWETAKVSNAKKFRLNVSKKPARSPVLGRKWIPRMVRNITSFDLCACTV